MNEKNGTFSLDAFYGNVAFVQQHDMLDNG
jgi:hypothetical protein